MGDEWLPAIYHEKIRVLRTRSVSIEVPEKENTATIDYTLLGIELQVGKRRFACPDLSTARYMRVFARLGCGQFAVPYDITKISAFADELETSWQRTDLLINEVMPAASTRSTSMARAKLIRAIRDQLREIGPGELMPAFDRETRQRK
ncbi:MAG: hypothetical protein ACJ73D_08320 [Pyrinomonadaceae bacterium]